MEKPFVDKKKPHLAMRLFSCCVKKNYFLAGAAAGAAAGLAASAAKTTAEKETATRAATMVERTFFICTTS
jgi:hypothetical protein